MRVAGPGSSILPHSASRIPRTVARYLVNVMAALCVLPPLPTALTVAT